MAAAVIATDTDRAPVTEPGGEPSARYRAGVSAGAWQADAAQEAVLGELDRLHAALTAPPRQHGLWPFRTKGAPAQGLYLWGKVGRGKTFLVDLLIAGLPPETVTRQHFHRFMAGVHDAMRDRDGQRDPLALVAADIGQRARLLCLDEFLVGDIGDAMILAGLLRGLFASGVVLVTTSNTPPEELYRDGLQRARFLPAIELIEAHCHLWHLASPHDWRRRALRAAPIYQTPDDATAAQALTRMFRQYATGEVVIGGTLRVQGRDIELRRHADNIAWFDFADLCDGPRAVADYIELARRYPALVIAHVPRLDDTQRDATRRLVQLVDEFYDRRVKLVLSAAAPIDTLYTGERARGEFERTRSRLIEMRSEAYLDLPHRP